MLVLWSTLLESYCIRFDQNLVEGMMLSLGLIAYLKNLYLLNEERESDLKILVVNSIFLLTKTTCLCVIMAWMGRIQFSS